MEDVMKKIITGVLAGLLIISSLGVTVSAAAKPATKPVKPSSTSTSTVQYYFPRAGQAPEPVLISLIDSAKTSVDMAIYSFTDTNIANALIKDEKRGVKVKLMSDKEESANSYQKALLATLKKSGIPIKINKHSGVMHLKVTIVDNKTATTGSFNYTKAAETENDEVFVVLNNATVAKDFDSEFNTMWNDTRNYSNY
jgi:phosphatidylserine/phosphatidylglycerophosphate/cardiolipin synthase-like enzyme